MAAPITHIILTEKVFEQYFSDKNKSDFFVGTSFPDIRYLGEITREETHFQHVTLEEIQKETNSFLAGQKFHSLIDLVREEFVISKNIYSFIENTKYTTQSVKFLEDEYLYDHVSKWDEYLNYFSEIKKEERKVNLTLKGIEKWHIIMQRYLANQPNDETRRDFIKSLQDDKASQIVDEINNNLQILKKQSKVKDYTNDLYNSINNLVETYE